MTQTFAHPAEGGDPNELATTGSAMEAVCERARRALQSSQQLLAKPVWRFVAVECCAAE